MVYVGVSLCLFLCADAECVFGYLSDEASDGRTRPSTGVAGVWRINEARCDGVLPLRAVYVLMCIT